MRKLHDKLKTRKHCLPAYHMQTDLTPETNPVSMKNECSCVSTWRNELRRQAIARRMLLSEEAWELYSAVICDLLRENFLELSHKRVGFCWPIRNEPDLRPLFEIWENENHDSFSTLLPVIGEENSTLSFRAWTPNTPMTIDRYGIPSPTTGDFMQPQALLIPLVAFDSQGYRLGYGGGFFDRTLSSLQPRPLSIGVGFELSRVDTIHPQPHDERLDAIVTEAGVFRFG